MHKRLLKEGIIHDKGVQNLSPLVLPKPEKCPYCKSIMISTELENHLYNKHPKEVRDSIVREIEKNPVYKVCLLEISKRKRLAPQEFIMELVIKHANELGKREMVPIYHPYFLMYREKEVRDLLERLPAKPCPRLPGKNANEIAIFLIDNFNNVRLKRVIDSMSASGFSREAFLKDRGVLFRSLVELAYDRWPYSGRLDKVRSLLENNRIFDLNYIRNVNEEELELILTFCEVGLGLTLCKADTTYYPRTIKEIASSVDVIADLLSKTRSGSDARILQKHIMKIHGFGPVLSAKFILFYIREKSVCHVPRSELGVIAKDLQKEYHNEKWVYRLKYPEFGGRPGLLREVWNELSEDPMAFDYFYNLNKDYCSQNLCAECSF